MSQASSYVYDKVVKGVGLAGLDNPPGTNICYVNSTLQCLFSSLHVRTFLSDDELFVKCLTAMQRNSAVNLAVVVRDVYNKLNNIETSVVFPHELMETIAVLWVGFERNSQADACDFLRFLLWTLHQELMTRERIIADSAPDLFTAWTTSSLSFVSQLCHLQTTNKVTCAACIYSSQTVPDASNHLSLDIGDSCSSVVDCLNLFCKVTSTDGKCPNCKSENTQSVEARFARIPPLLIIQLKRFKQLTGVKFMKNKSSISFDTSLDLAPYVTGELQTNSLYKLIAVQNHIGDLSNGHYTAFCQRDNRWYKFDDTRVSSITTRRMVSEHAYLLWYEKALDVEAVRPFDFKSFSDAILPSLVTPEYEGSLSPLADPNNNYHQQSPDLFADSQQQSPGGADELLDISWTPQQSPPVESQQPSDLTQYARINTEATVAQREIPLHFHKRKEVSDERIASIRPLPPPELNPQEPHKCLYAEFDFDMMDPILTEDDVMGAKLDVDNLEQYTVQELKRWLHCRRIRTEKVKKQGLIKLIRDQVAMGKKDKIDSKVDEGIWFVEKRKKIALENPQDPRVQLPHLPVVAFNMWKPFPTIHIPEKLDYNKIEQYFDGIPEVVFSVETGVRTRIEDYDSDDEIFDASLPDVPDRKRKFLTNTLGRGKVFLDSGRILSVFNYEDKKGHYYIKAMVHASMRNKVYMTIITIATYHGDVCNGTCTCKANALGRCCHIAAVLLLIHRHKQNAAHEAVTCTGRACYWIGGSNHKDPGVVREKGSYYTGYDYQRRAYYNPIPSRYQNSTPEEEAEVVKQFSDKIKVLPFRSLYAYHLPNDTDTELFPEIDETLLLSELCSFVHWSLNSIREVAGGKPYELPRTRKQHESEFWESERAIRISASKSKLFLGLTSESAKINYFRKNMWGFKRPPTEAMLLGIRNEAIARKKYIEEYMKPDDPNAKMHQTGSWVNPAYPMLLCTPDGIIEGSSQCKLFETKYCHILQGADPRDFQTALTKKQQSSFYLRYENGRLVLKENHPYNYQVQMSMDILQLEICEFAVLSGDAEKGWQMAVVTVQYNESFWREKRERLIQKHRHLLVPEHFLGRTVKNLPPRELVYSKFHEDYKDPHFLQGGFQLNVYWQLRLEDPDTFFTF